MLAEMISRIASLTERANLQPKEVEIDGVTFWMDPDGKLGVPVPPSRSCFSVHTLRGVGDFLNANIDGFGADELFVHVASPSLVRVVEADPRRNALVIAEPIPPEVKVTALNQWQSQEDFILNVQRAIYSGKERSRLLSIVGNIASEEVGTSSDDGVTQQVVTRQGARLGRDEVKNPFELKPRRSFPEPVMPDAPFVLRVRPVKGEPPKMALFDAHDSRWQVEAIDKIKEYLTAVCPEGTPIIG